MTTRVCLAGATGWAGSALARAIAQSDAIELVAAISRTHAQRILGDVLAEPRLTCPVYATVQQALANACDVFMEYTKPDVAKANILAALRSFLACPIKNSLSAMTQAVAPNHMLMARCWRYTRSVRLSVCAVASIAFLT
jgi:hypothetical protein